MWGSFFFMFLFLPFGSDGVSIGEALCWEQKTVKFFFSLFLFSSQAAFFIQDSRDYSFCFSCNVFFFCSPHIVPVAWVFLPCSTKKNLYSLVVYSVSKSLDTKRHYLFIQSCPLLSVLPTYLQAILFSKRTALVFLLHNYFQHNIQIAVDITI